MDLPEPIQYTKVPNSHGEPQERFYQDKELLVREVLAGSYAGNSTILCPTKLPAHATVSDLRRVWWRERLRGRLPSIHLDPRRKELKIVDLCAGCGGLAMGVKWASEAVGLRPVFQACVEVTRDALNVYKNNLRPLRSMPNNLTHLVRYQSNPEDRGGQAPRLESDILAGLVGEVDLLIAGPPCEGNSNFNNKTRRTDRRNELYVAAVACAIALDAKAVIIENVVSVKRASQNVVGRATKMLVAAGYKIGNCEEVLEASWFGTPQKRRRHFLIASKSYLLDMRSALDQIRCPPISVIDAISDLVGLDPSTEFDRPAKLSAENDRRVKYLIKNDEWNLPDAERPDCHQDGNHTYSSVYGRMYPHEPAQTLTTGFLSPGRGRFTHPIEARGLTLHEGARLQGFPDDFRFLGRRGEPINRHGLAHLIGDAVPPQLGYATGLAAISVL